MRHMDFLEAVSGFAASHTHVHTLTQKSDTQQTHTHRLDSLQHMHLQTHVFVFFNADTYAQTRTIVRSHKQGESPQNTLSHTNENVLDRKQTHTRDTQTHSKVHLKALYSISRKHKHLGMQKATTQVAPPTHHSSFVFVTFAPCLLLLPTSLSCLLSLSSVTSSSSSSSSCGWQATSGRYTQQEISSRHIALFCSPRSIKTIRFHNSLRSFYKKFPRQKLRAE